jgi:O-antigen/teichoic acid export membrane protein
MADQKDSYKQIVKATTIFGGANLFKVLAALLKGKLLALFLGPEGMGINSLFVSSTNVITNVTGLGLNFSAVRNISQAKESGDVNKFSRTLSIFKKLVMFTALIGLASTIILSPLLSRFTFGSDKYIISFVLLGLMVFFTALSSGYASIIQGIRDVKNYGKQIVVSSLLSLVAIAPMYYFFRMDAIVPALIAGALITYFVVRYYSKETGAVKMNVGGREVIGEGREMLKLGIAMMVATSIGALVHYLINTFVTNYGSLSDQGLYQAAMSITNQSVGLIFSAMAVDFYPKLAAVCKDNSRVKEMVNQQGEVMVLISAPILGILVVFAPLAIRILLSAEFMPSADMVRIFALGMLFKAASYSIGAISFAKGDKRVFFILEGLYTNFSILLFLAVGYAIGGLMGLAWSFTVMHAVYLAVIIFVTGKLYKYRLSANYIKIFLVQLFFITTAAMSSLVLDNIYATAVGISIIALSLVFSYRELDKLIGIRLLIDRLLKRKA